MPSSLGDSSLISSLAVFLAAFSTGETLSSFLTSFSFFLLLSLSGVFFALLQSSLPVALGFAALVFTLSFSFSALEFDVDPDLVTGVFSSAFSVFTFKVGLREMGSAAAFDEEATGGSALPICCV